MRIPNALATVAWGLFVTAIGPGVLSAQSSTLTVQNERNEHVTIYIEQMGSQVAGNVDVMNARIGDVAPASTNTFALPEWAMERPEGDLTFIVQVEGKGELAPVEMTAREGDDLGIIVVEQDDLMETIEAPTVEPGEASVRC